MHTPPDGMPVWVGVLVCVVSSDALRSSVLTDLKQRGACNQRQEGFVILLDQFGNTPFPLFILVRSPAGNKQAYPVATGNLLGIP